MGPISLSVTLQQAEKAWEEKAYELIGSLLGAYELIVTYEENKVL
jgi:hypothetical protein